MALASPAGGSHALLRVAGDGLRAVLEAKQGMFQSLGRHGRANGPVLAVRIPCVFCGVLAPAFYRR